MKKGLKLPLKGKNKSFKILVRLKKFSRQFEFSFKKNKKNLSKFRIVSRVQKITKIGR